MPNSPYPVPSRYPTYQQPLHKVHDGRKFSWYELIDSVFIVIAIALCLWLSGLLVWGTFVASPTLIIPLTLAWILVAYLMLPRLHQLFTLIYLPDYFIGRTKTVDGLLGDPVNLAFDGAEEDIHALMQKAGWSLADPITLRSSWKIIISSLFRRSYPNAPVSDLVLFGRSQNFAYQQEVEGSASRRHHVRFWRVPQGWVLPGGHRAEWLAAGTFDRGVGFSTFTFQITHKIDADTDLERDYIINTLRFTDPKVSVRVIEDFSTAYHHRNGGGDAIRTDGHLPVVDLSGGASRTGNTNIITPTPKKTAADHRVPPPGLLATGVLIGFDILFMVLAWIIVSTGEIEYREVAEVSFDEFAPVTGLFLVHGFFWIYTLRHHKWARIGLMTTATLSAFRSLVMLTADHNSLSAIIMTFFSVLMMLAISGDATRLWVEKEPTRRRRLVATQNS